MSVPGDNYLAVRFRPWERLSCSTTRDQDGERTQSRTTAVPECPAMEIPSAQDARGREGIKVIQSAEWGDEDERGKGGRWGNGREEEGRGSEEWGSRGRGGGTG